VSVEGTLSTYLSAYAGLTALVLSSDGTTRVYASQAPQGAARPYVVHFPVSGPYDQTLTGRSGAREIHEQLSCFGGTLASAEAVADQVEAALEAWAVSASRVGPVLVQGRYNLSEEDTDLFHVVIEALILYQEGVS
jgi:hypothetical protein